MEKHARDIRNGNADGNHISTFDACSKNQGKRDKQHTISLWQQNSISKLLKKFMVNESAIFYMIVTVWLLVFSYDFY